MPATSAPLGRISSPDAGLVAGTDAYFSTVLRKPCISDQDFLSASAS
jgi:hypothetical protein